MSLTSSRKLYGARLLRPNIDVTNEQDDKPGGFTVSERVVWEAGALSSSDDELAEEVPVAFEYNCLSYAVMMASPIDLLDFAVGFSLTEGVIRSPEDLLDIEIVSHPSGGRVISMIIEADRLEALKARRRRLVGNSGCGVCGIESIEQFERLASKTSKLNPVSSKLETLSHAAIQRALEQLDQAQMLNRRTGAVHAAAWVDLTGQLKLIREDIGRHNALDKLLGARASENARGNAGFAEGFVVMSSRASYELVQKTATQNINVLVAVSGVTRLAVETANKYGITLVGYARTGRHSIYAGPNRFAKKPK